MLANSSRRRFSLAAIFVSLAAAALLAAPAIATADQGVCTDSWISGGSGSWTDPSNWSNGVPTGTDDVCIDQDGNYTVTLDAAAAVNSLSLGLPSSVGTQELDIVAPQGASAGLTINSDSTIGATGSLVLDSPAGAGSAVVSGSSATIADYGSIESQVESANTNTLNTDVDVETGGSLVAFSGELDAEGTIKNQGEVSVGTGTLYVDRGSVDNAGGAVYNGGTLRLFGGTWSQDGGSESGNPVTLFDCAFLGNAPGSTGAFDLTGGVSVTGAITAGETLTVLGTPALSANANLQYDVVNEGTLVLDGAGGDATLTDDENSANELTNDATVDTTDSDGGQAEVVSDVENESSGRVDVQSGQLTQYDGTTTNDGEVTIDAAGQYDLDGGTFDQQSDGTLTFQITGGTTFGTLDIAGGVFNLNGGAAAVNLEGYAPSVGTEFDVVTGSYGAGRFATVPSEFVADYSNPAAIGLIVVPTVTSVSPNNGPAAGGTSVTITGSNLAGATAVDFGGQPASIVSDSATQISATSPPTTSPGTVDVTVTVNGETSPANPQDQFTYQTDVVNRQLPGISGTAQDGSVLTTSNGTWTAPSALTYAYQWQRCDGAGANCVNISGATKRTFKLTSADVSHQIDVVVTATDRQGEEASATATPVGPAAAPAPPHNAAPPQISGTLQDGATLRAVVGKWTSPDSLRYSYQWDRCSANGTDCQPTGPTTSTFKLTSAEVGEEIALVVTATDQEGQNGQATAGPIGPVANPAPPSNTTLPAITGEFTAGQTLTTTNGKWSSPDQLTYGYQWEDCDSSGANCMPLAGADHRTYRLTSSDIAGTVTVIVTATDREGQPGQATANPYPSKIVSQ